MKEDYIRGFAQKCAEHGIRAKDLIKEAGRGEALASLLDALTNTYSSSGLQGGIEALGEGAGDVWDKVVDSDVVQAIGDAGKATGEGAMSLLEKLKSILPFIGDDK